MMLASLENESKKKVERLKRKVRERKNQNKRLTDGAIALFVPVMNSTGQDKEEE